MAETGIGGARQLGQFIARDGASGEQLEDLGRDRMERGVCEFRNRRSVDARPCLRHVKAAVAGKAGEQGVFEAQLRSFASGADVAHGTRLSRLGGLRTAHPRTQAGAKQGIRHAMRG